MSGKAFKKSTLCITEDEALYIAQPTFILLDGIQVKGSEFVRLRLDLSGNSRSECQIDRRLNILITCAQNSGLLSVKSNVACQVNKS